MEVDFYTEQFWFSEESFLGGRIHLSKNPSGSQPTYQDQNLRKLRYTVVVMN